VKRATFHVRSYSTIYGGAHETLADAVAAAERLTLRTSLAATVINAEGQRVAVVRRVGDVTYYKVEGA
jgi:hypothetical protein